jgi:FAD/FMN-containing dehydrogenase
MVAEPKTEEDILKILQFAGNEGLNIVCRGGGSGLSGAGVGNGIILDFKRYFDHVLSVGEETIVQPGTILDTFLDQMARCGLMLPSVPSSSALCALGGNVGTRSTGPRTAKYGTIDPFISTLRFITSKGEIVDTKDCLPDYLAQRLEQIRNQYLADMESRNIIDTRPFIAGGYNLKALSSYNEVRNIATHLMVGSIGTLGIITEIRLKPMEHKPSLGTYFAHFRDFDEFAEAAVRLKELNPAALEFSDAVCSRHVNGKFLNLSDPNIVGTIMVEFDDSTHQAKQGRDILEKFNITEVREVPAGSKDEALLWEDRRRILPSLWKYAKSKNRILPSIIDDVAIHPKDFGPVRKALQNLMNKLGHEIAFFGHLGFGSVHARPFFDPNEGELVKQIIKVSQESFRVLRQYKGTLVGEHNAGRSRSVYLEKELGPAYSYLKKIKTLFDPDDMLNPGVLFDTAPIYVNMDLDR